MFREKLSEEITFIRKNSHGKRVLYSKETAKALPQKPAGHLLGKVERSL